MEKAKETKKAAFEAVSEGNGLFFLFNKGLGGAGKEIGEEKNESGESLLFVTAKTPGSEVAMKWLVAKGADVNVQNENDGKTPLHAAAESKQTGVVKLLLKSGADETVKSKELAKQGQIIEEIIELKREVEELKPLKKELEELKKLVESLRK